MSVYFYAFRNEMFLLNFYISKKSPIYPVKDEESNKNTI